MAAATDVARGGPWRLACVLGVALCTTPARGQDFPRIEQVGFRMSVFNQHGRGYQSQDHDGSGPGDERLLVLQPIAQLRVRQSARVEHTVTIPVDVVSAASLDVIDATSSASKINEAAGVEVETEVSRRDTQYVFRYGAHVEEPFWSGNAGVGVEHTFAQGNAVFSASVDAIYDSFDKLDHRGYDTGLVHRWTSGATVGLSQVLSPSTVATVGYGFTWQRGFLQTGYNSVPLDDGKTAGELFPPDRFRQAFSGGVVQFVAPLEASMRAGYRLYVDSFDLVAHTVETEYRQLLGSQVLAKVGYRFHTQTGVHFFAPRFDRDTVSAQPRTADSDLAPFEAHEVTLELRYYWDDPIWVQPEGSFVEASYTRYGRSNGLDVDVIALGYCESF